MKKIYFLITLLPLSYTHVFGQEQKNTFGFSVGKTFFGTGDIWGNNVTGIYERKLVKRISLQARISHAQGYNYTESSVPSIPFYSNNYSQKLTAGLLVNLLQINRHTLGINAGVTSLRTSRFRSGGYMMNPDPNAPKELEYIPGKASYKKEMSIGGTLGLHYKLRLNKHLLAGFQADYHHFGNGDVEENLNLVLFYAF